MANQARDRCYYTILGISKTATSADIKKVYNKLVLIHHPDKGGRPEMFVKVQDAYETLRDPILRQAYDRKNQGATFRKAKEAEADFGTDFETDFGTKARRATPGRADGPRKGSAAPRKQREDEPHAEPQRGESFYKEPHRRPSPKADHGDRFEERRPRSDSTFAQERARADAFFENGPFWTDISFFDDDDFEVHNFGKSKGHTNDCHHPADKNRKEPQAQERGQPDQTRGKPPPKHTEEANARRCAFDKTPCVSPTFESLLLCVQDRCKVFIEMFSNLYGTTGPHFPASTYGDVWCHLQHIKDLLKIRILSIELAQSNHALKESRQGLKEGALSPSKENISTFLDMLEFDYVHLKGTGELMSDAFELAEDLSDRMEKKHGIEKAQYVVCMARLDRAMLKLQKHVKKFLF